MRLSGFRLPLEHLSATSLGTFAACPEQFRRKYLLKESEKLSGDRFIGSVAHESLQKLFEHEGDAEPQYVVGKAWQEIIEREGEPEWYETDATEAYQRTQKMISTYWPTAKQTEPVAVEQRFEEKVSGVNIVGYIDLELLDRIREVKTSSRKQTKPKSRHRLQGRLYSLVSDKPIEWHYVTRQVTPQVYTAEGCPDLYATFSKDVTVKMMTNLIEYMNNLYARHGKDETWPLSGTYGDWTCDYCSFKKNCYAWQ